MKRRDMIVGAALAVASARIAERMAAIVDPALHGRDNVATADLYIHAAAADASDNGCPISPNAHQRSE
jgi:hypothetical protein